MNPDLARAIPELQKRALLPEDAALRLLRAARGELVSLRWELRTLLYAGVLLVTGGVALLVKENFDRIGPVAIALAIALAVAGCFAWVARKAPPFSTGEVASPDLAFDYVLLLGALLAAADLAFVEWRLSPLGASWPWHLLVVSLFYGVLSFRYDSRVVFALALSTFAAWRGVSTAFVERGLWGSGDDVVRVNAILVGLLFLGLGLLLLQAGWKAHFEPTAVHAGALLLLGALFTGSFESGSGVAWSTVLLVVAVGIALWGWRARRYSLFAMGVVGGYVGLTAMIVRNELGAALGCWWIAATSLAVLGGLYAAHRHMKQKEPL